MYNQNNPYGQNNYQQPMYGQQPVQQQYNQYQPPMNQPQYNQGYYMQQPPKKSSSLPIIIVVVLILMVVGGAFFMGLFDSEKSEKNSNSNSNETINKNEMANTSWISSRDGSAQVVFTDDKISWYKDYKDHNNNYHTGKYKYFRGKEAIEHMDSLTSLGVTKEEIYEMIDRNEEYNEKNFVVFDSNIEESIVDGQKKNSEIKQMIWFGFILDNDTQLELLNASSLSYLYFKKE